MRITFPLLKYPCELLLLILVFFFVFTKDLKNAYDKVIMAEGHGYYAYLPAVFIYDDLSFKFFNELEPKYYNSHYEPPVNLFVTYFDGISLNKYYPGVSLLWLPFFLLAHLLALLFHLPADGYSDIYQYAIGLAGIVYTYAGLRFTQKILQHFNVGRPAIFLSLTGILLATNFLLYAVTWSSQPHAYAFFVIAAFCWYTIQFSKNTAANSFYLCMMLVLAALLLTMRPQNILILLLLPFFGFFNKSFKEFLSSVFSFWGITGILLACFIIFRVNYYWYMQTGRLVLNPYTGEHFYFNNPHFFETLFSFRKGWLLYSPWVVLGLAGIFFIPGLKKKLNLLFFWIILIYIFSSWWCWTYSPTSFGQRVYIDFYCLIALTSGLLFEFLHRRKLLWTATIILILAIPLNIHQMYQYRKGIITSDFYHAEVYFKNFFVTRRIAQFPIPPDIIDFKKTHALHFQNGSGTVSVKKPFSGSFKVPVPPQMKPDHCSFLRMRAKLLVTEGSRPLNLVADFHTKGRSAFYKAFEISRHNFPVNTKSEFEAGMNIPENISECDSVLIYVWRPDAPGKDSCQVKNISIEFIHVDPSYELK